MTSRSVSRVTVSATTPRDQSKAKASQWIERVLKGRDEVDRTRLRRAVLLDNPNNGVRRTSASETRRRREREKWTAGRAPKKVRREPLLALNDPDLEAKMVNAWTSYFAGRNLPDALDALADGTVNLCGARVHVVSCACHPHLAETEGVVLKETVSAVHLSCGPKLVIVPKRPKTELKLVLTTSSSSSVAVPTTPFVRS